MRHKNKKRCDDHLLQVISKPFLDKWEHLIDYLIEIKGVNLNTLAPYTEYAVWKRLCFMIPFHLNEFTEENAMATYLSNKLGSNKCDNTKPAKQSDIQYIKLITHLNSEFL